MSTIPFKTRRGGQNTHERVDVCRAKKKIGGGTNILSERPSLHPRCSPSAAAPLWSGLARRAAATRSGAWLLGAGTSVRHSSGRRAQYVLLVLLHAPLQVAVLDEHVWLERLAGERAQAVAVAPSRSPDRKRLRTF